jgi:isoleucyl-tRNA synthetase
VFFHTAHAIPDAKLSATRCKAWASPAIQETVRKESRKAHRRSSSALRCRPRSTPCAGRCYEALASLGEDLRFVLITSRAAVRAPKAGGGPGDAQRHPKCDRCWHYRADVNADGLCGRCQRNLKGR